MPLAKFKKAGKFAGAAHEPQIEIKQDDIDKPIKISQTMADNLAGSEFVEIVEIETKPLTQEIETKPLRKRK